MPYLNTSDEKKTVVDDYLILICVQSLSKEVPVATVTESTDRASDDVT